MNTVWATLEHHTTFRASPIYPIVLPLLRKAVANGAPASDITFVSFTGPHEGALFAPTTEISLVTLADRTTIDELRGALQRGMQSIRDVKFPAIVGNVVGKSGKAVFVIGWDDVVVSKHVLRSSSRRGGRNIDMQYSYVFGHSVIWVPARIPLLPVVWSRLDR